LWCPRQNYRFYFLTWWNIWPTVCYVEGSKWQICLTEQIVALCADNTNTNFGGCKGLGKIMCGENFKLNGRGRLSVLVVGHTLYTIVSSVLSTVYQLILNVLQWKYTNTSICTQSALKNWKTSVTLQDTIMLNC
jgi:hypothetical protein